MQTLSIQVEDNYIQQFMNFVKDSHSNITVTEDKNIEFDSNYTPVRNGTNLSK